GALLALVQRVAAHDLRRQGSARGLSRAARRRAAQGRPRERQARCGRWLHPRAFSGADHGGRRRPRARGTDRAADLHRGGRGGRELYPRARLRHAPGLAQAADDDREGARWHDSRGAGARARSEPGPETYGNTTRARRRPRHTTLSDLVVRDLHVTVEGKPILNGIDLTVESGSVHAMMGPNGSGKSTLSPSILG